LVAKSDLSVHQVQRIIDEPRGRQPRLEVHSRLGVQSSIVALLQHFETMLIGSLLGGTIHENRDKALTRHRPSD
jgi:hypothetical protein